MSSPPPKRVLNGPPEINRRNKGRFGMPSFISNEDRNALNSNAPPSVDWRDYTPEASNTALLFNVKSGFDYKKNAIQKMGDAWATFCKDKPDCDEIKKAECSKHGIGYQIFKDRMSKIGGKRKITRKRGVRKNTTARKRLVKY